MKLNAQKTYDRVLASAVCLFDQQGFEETSIEDICQHADIGRSTFYKYFSGKDELAYDLYTKEYIFNPDNIAWILSGSTPTERLVRVHLCTLRHPTVKCGAGVFFAQCRHMINTASSDTLFNRYPMELFYSLAEQAQQAGEVQYVGDVKVSVRQYNTASFGLYISWLIMKKNFDLVSGIIQNLRYHYHLREDIPVEEYVRNCFV